MNLELHISVFDGEEALNPFECALDHIFKLWMSNSTRFMVMTAAEVKSTYMLAFVSMFVFLLHWGGF